MGSRSPALHPHAAWGLTTLMSRTGRSVLDYDRDSRSQPECRLGDPRGAGLGIESQSVKGAGRSPARKYPPICTHVGWVPAKAFVL